MRRFKPGMFVARKTDREQQFPVIWRISGKTLIQKYDPVFKLSGKVSYKPSTIHVEWTPAIKHLYQLVRVHFHMNKHLKMVVKFVKFEDNWLYQDFLHKVAKDMESYHPSFNVYIQILISCVLDISFVSRMKKGGYFHSHYTLVDNILETKKVRLLNFSKWMNLDIPKMLSSRPNYTVINWVDPHEIIVNSLCAGCNGGPVVRHVCGMGDKYHPLTLRSIPDAPNAPNPVCDESVGMCEACSEIAWLYHATAHFKYMTYHLIRNHVLKKRAEDPCTEMQQFVLGLMENKLWINTIFASFEMIVVYISKLGIK